MVQGAPGLYVGLRVALREAAGAKQVDGDRLMHGWRWAEPSPWRPMSMPLFADLRKIAIGEPGFGATGIYLDVGFAGYVQVWQRRPAIEFRPLAHQPDHCQRQQ